MSLSASSGQDSPDSGSNSPSSATSPPDGGEHNAPALLAEDEVLTVLANGVVEEQGLLPYSSNHSFLILVAHDGLTLPAVYKPQRGESPLWDFEWGTLCKRETAAYLIDTALNWALVPPTVLRDGTRGLGSIQFYVDNDTDAHYFTTQADARFVEAYRKLALFDYIINNADRKSGHCLNGSDNRVWAIDHGVCFHVEYKLRTVIWEFSQQPIEPDMLQDIVYLSRLLDDSRDPLTRQIRTLLSEGEWDALTVRVGQLLHSRLYPAPSPYRRNYPWPPI